MKTSAQTSEKNEAKLSSHEQKASDEQNNESQRQKVKVLFKGLIGFWHRDACVMWYDLHIGHQKQQVWSSKVKQEAAYVQVLEEREKLKQEREIRMKKKEYLIKELEQLRKQQGT